jgi:hypothetical protein
LSEAHGGDNLALYVENVWFAFRILGTKKFIEISFLSMRTKNWRALGGNLRGRALYRRLKGNFGVEQGNIWGQIGVF